MSKPPLAPAIAEFGQRVREARIAASMSQEALAEAAGLHWTFVSQVERGQRNLSFTNILKLAGGLDVDPGSLLRGLALER